MFVKIVVFVPETHANHIRYVLAENGAGHIGNYSHCSFSVTGIGRFKGGEGTNPSIGESGKIESVIEERIETIAPKDSYEEIIAAVRDAHPYEEPAIDVYELLYP